MNQTPNNSSRPHRRWLPWVAYSIISVVGVAVLVAGATYMFGAVAGEEFCPGTFERRSFLYYQVPLFRIQVTPIWRSDETNSLENALRSQKLIPARAADKRRWDLVFTMRSVADITHGDASILCTYLDARDERDDLYWETWTKDHPKLAKVLWPAVGRVAQQQLYLFTPEMIDLAKSAQAESFATELESLLVRQYHQLAVAQQKMGSHETAVELLDEAISLAPDDQELIRCREESKQFVDSSGEP